MTKRGWTFTVITCLLMFVVMLLANSSIMFSLSLLIFFVWTFVFGNLVGDNPSKFYLEEKAIKTKKAIEELNSILEEQAYKK